MPPELADQVRTRSLRRRRAGIAVALAAAAAAGWVGVRASRTGKDEATDPFFVVQRGSLRISLTESGSIQNRERVIIRSEVEGRRTILTLVDEGKYVEAGELLVEIDSSGLEESRVEQQIRVENAEAQFINSRENLSIVSNASQALVDDAEMALRFARIEMEKFEKADYAQQLQHAGGDITIAQEELQRSEDRADWSRRLMEQGYLTRTEMQADNLSAMRARLGLDLARSKLGVLTNYTYSMTKEKLAREIVKSEMALARAKMRASADLIQAAASARASQSEYMRQKDRLDLTIQQIAKCRIVAPSDGMVVYATTVSSRRFMQEPLRPGVDVVERQELIHLPATRGMMALVQLQEHNLPKLRTGMPAEIRVSALPGRTFRGHVERIGIMPDSSMSWLNPDIKVYDCHVWIDESTEVLRQGMSCRVEILIEEYEDAVFVPVQCVVRVENRPTVYVLGSTGAVPREVEAGLDNNRMMRIVSGVEPGEHVVLAPPLPPSDAMGVRFVNADAEPPNGMMPPPTNGKTRSQQPEERGARESGGPRGGGSGDGGRRGPGEGGNGSKSRSRPERPADAAGADASPQS